MKVLLIIAVYLLLNLVGTVVGCQVNNKTQFACGVLNILFLKYSFLSLIGPCEAFICIQATINTGCQYYEPPTNCFEHLKYKR